MNEIKKKKKLKPNDSTLMNVVAIVIAIQKIDQESNTNPNNTSSINPFMHTPNNKHRLNIIHSHYKNRNKSIKQSFFDCTVIEKIVSLLLMQMNDDGSICLFLFSIDWNLKGIVFCYIL